MALLEVKNLTKHFEIGGGFLSSLGGGKKLLKAVDQISFSVPEGKTFGLVGESGCGKSTTARLITRLIPATTGEVYFEGMDVLKLPKRDMRKLRKHIQMIFQDPYASLNPRMRVVDIIGRLLPTSFEAKVKKESIGSSNCSSSWACAPNICTVIRTSSAAVSASGLVSRAHWRQTPN